MRQQKWRKIPWRYGYHLKQGTIRGIDERTGLDKSIPCLVSRTNVGYVDGPSGGLQRFPKKRFKGIKRKQRIRLQRVERAVRAKAATPAL